jgi:hypothetical protein
MAVVVSMAAVAVTAAAVALVVVTTMFTSIHWSGNCQSKKVLCYKMWKLLMGPQLMGSFG